MTALSIPSETDPDHDYTVHLSPDGRTASCTCAQWEHRRIDCKHIRTARRRMTTTALQTIQVAPPPAILPTPAELESMDMLAVRLYSSGAVAIPENLKTPQDVMTVILAGWELGVKPGTALRHIAVIKGKAEPDGQLMAGIVTSRESDASFEIEVDDGQQVTVRFRRPKRGYNVLYTYTMEDAKKAGLVGGVNWQKFPRDMMRWAAIKRLCRTYANDLINGITSMVYGDMPDEYAPKDDPDYIRGEARVIEVVESPADLRHEDLYSPGDEPAEHGQQETGASASSATAAEADTTSPAPPPDETEPDPARPSFDEVTTLIQSKLVDCKQTWSPTDYGTLYRDLLQEFMPEGSTKFNVAQLSYEQAVACLQKLRERRQEPPA